jgi:uncharacterized protein YraI
MQPPRSLANYPAMEISMRKALLSGLVLALMTLPAAPALAGEARASGDVTVRIGPGSNYRPIDRLTDGEYYEVLECTRQARWCLVGDRLGEIGWVRGSYLVGEAAKIPVTPFESAVDPSFNFGFGHTDPFWDDF